MPTLELADAALNMAIEHARKLEVSLIIAGDLHDSKANIRAECANRIIETFKKAQIAPYLLVGNHDKINEKSEEHALNFLEPYCHIIDKPEYLDHIKTWAIPYQHDTEQLTAVLAKIREGSRLVMHQGCSDSNSGHYIQDKTALPKDKFKTFRVISGHYHTRQDIKTGRPQKGAIGLFSYIGNPYTVNFGEAKDPEKGFQVLYEDGTLEFIPTKLRKHVVHEMTVDEYKTSEYPKVNLGDIVKLKITGTKEQLAGLTKEQIKNISGIENFSLELIPVETVFKQLKRVAHTQPELLDSLIEAINNSSDEQKIRLKNLWRAFV